MPRLAVLFSRSIPLALLRHDVHDHWMIDVANLFKGSDQRFNIIAVFDKAVIEAHDLEEIVRRLALCLAQLAEGAVHAAVILGNRHIIVVEDHDEIRAELADRIEALQRLTAAHRAISDDRDDVLMATGQVTSLGQSRCQRDGRRRMTDIEEIVFTFRRVRVAGHIIVMCRIRVRLLASRQHLVRIRLMRDIKDNLIPRGGEDCVQRYSRLDEAEIRPDMTAMYTGPEEKRSAHLLNERLALHCI